jgi:AcrR family transcriptional regulator
LQSERRPPGRPRRAERRPPPDQALLDAADELFYRDGIPATGVDALATAAGVSKVSIYQHFGSKDALAAAYIQRRDQHFTQWFLDQVDLRHDEPRAQLLAVFDILLQFVRQPEFRGCAFINAATDTRAGPPADPVLAAVQIHKHRMRAWLAQTAAAADLANPDDLAAQLALLVDGAVVQAAIERSENPVAAARAAAAVIIASHAPTPPPAPGRADSPLPE